MLPTSYSQNYTLTNFIADGSEVVQLHAILKVNVQHTLCSCW